jgi:hypothetical protein
MSSNAQTTSHHIQSYCMYVRAYLTILHYEPSHFGGSDMALVQELSNRRLVRSGADGAPALPGLAILTGESKGGKLSRLCSNVKFPEKRDVRVEWRSTRSHTSRSTPKLVRALCVCFYYSVSFIPVHPRSRSLRESTFPLPFI